jgi:Divergent InlB B-repeat domain
MAITSASPAFNTADPAYELSTDQRGIARPQDGLPDIGAYEACVGGRFGLTPCQGGVIEQPPPTELLTIQASPATGGTTDPTPGLHSIVEGTVLLIHAVPTPGNSFLGWTGAVTDPTNPDTTIIMNQPQSVTAQFTNLTTTMAGNITAKTGPSNARAWTLSLEDNGPAGAAGVTIPGFALTQTGGAACTPIVNTTFPLSIGTLLASQTGTADVLIDFSSCAAAARFTATFTYTANYGTVTGSVVRTNQFQ